jgi:hypothetical protein
LQDFNFISIFPFLWSRVGAGFPAPISSSFYATSTSQPPHPGQPFSCALWAAAVVLNFRPHSWQAKFSFNPSNRETSSLFRETFWA